MADSTNSDAHPKSTELKYKNSSVLGGADSCSNLGRNYEFRPRNLSFAIWWILGV